MATIELDRGRVLAHRAVVQDLTGPAGDVAARPLLGLGVQDTPPGSGHIALAARASRSAPPVTELLAEGGPLAVVMAARGAPHVVARSQLPLLAAALFPLDEREGAEVEEVAQAMRAIVDGPVISRPALSRALNDKVADSLRSWCDRCAARHVREGLFRKATLQAGLELDPAATSPTTFRPSGARPSGGPDRQEALAELARRYLHVTGVATPADLAAWLGDKPGKVRAAWTLIAQELTPCTVAGKRRWALTSDLESLTSAPRPVGANLLAPSDPYLLGDRALVVPERDHQRQLWRAVANPGAILLDGEIAGTWRHRRSGRQLHVTLAPFCRDPFNATVMRDLTRAAENVAALRDAHQATITLAAAKE